MNLDPRPQSPPSAEVEFQLKRWLPVLGGLVAAVYAGYWVGNNNWVPLCVMVSVTLVCFVAFSLQENAAGTARSDCLARQIPANARSSRRG